MTMTPSKLHFLIFCTSLLLLTSLSPVTVFSEPLPWDIHPHTTPRSHPILPDHQPLFNNPYITDKIRHLNETLLRGYLQNITAFGPRKTGTPNCTAAATYLSQTFTTMGLQVRLDNWTQDGINGTNIEATLPGANTSPVLIICGHYDCVPAGPGADDDGSGIAAVLASAALLKDAHLNHTIRFVCFSGEEQGLLGSHHYAQQQALHNQSILAVLNADMIGYTENTNDSLLVKIFYDNASTWLYNYTQNISQLYTPDINLQVDPMGYTWGSDHNSFWTFGYQALFYHEFKFNTYYHSANDTIIHMNLSYHAHIARLMLATLIDLASQPRPILRLTSLNGGFGCTATITNAGDAPAVNPVMAITISPGVFGFFGVSHAWSIQGNLPANGSLTHQCVGFGIGRVTITITAAAENLTFVARTATAFELGPLILRLSQT